MRSYIKYKKMNMIKIKVSLILEQVKFKISQKNLSFIDLNLLLRDKNLSQARKKNHQMKIFRIKI